jgi:3-hydroxymyristoyl/3-hydroxydecanoyl-(acyl carrier protein) dehydratase
LVSADGSIPTGADKLARVKALKARLRAGFEAVVLPRRWRFVAALPQNELGKVTQAALARLFEPPTQPEWLSEERREGGVLRLHLRLPPDLVYFEGHFPGAPVLAGVVQLDWAVEEGRRRLGLVGRFVGLKALKFSKPLLPGDVAVLELCAEADGLRFSYESAAGRHSSGKVLFAPDDGL